MASAPVRIQLICPGFFGPIPALPQPMPRLASIERLLGRADCAIVDWCDPFSPLFAAFGLDHASVQDLPTAPIALLGESVEVDPDAYWLHADPIHLRPDRDRLLLFAGDAIAPDRTEADALVDAFNLHFADDGLHLVAPVPNRWYLRVEGDPPPSEVPLYRLLGQPLDPMSVSSAKSRRWSSLLNEIQMLFHAHPVNRTRMDSGRPAISGIWGWGGGRLPERVASDLGCVTGEHPLLLGLGHLAGLSRMPLDGSTAAVLVEQGGGLVYWDGLWQALMQQDLEAWGSALEALDIWMAGIEIELRRGQLSVFDIQGCEAHHFRVNRLNLRRFWRKGGFLSRLRVGRAFL